jgi:RING finger/CHY zinc finger protein 1
MNNGEHGCEHYVRRCRLVAPCCDNVYWCRHCHNDAEAHEMDRHAVKEVVCDECNMQQSVSNTCLGCGIQFAAYFCAVCNFFDDRIERNYYHCDKCGICRVKGGKEYVHCDNCGTCVALLDHTCRREQFHTDCPVCLENLFHSTKQANVLPCGHTMHVHCLLNCFEQNRLSCPMCRKTMLSSDSLQQYNDGMDALICAYPIQEELVFAIKCNDCGFGGEVHFHPYGMKCGGCGGYNTAR